MSQEQKIQKSAKPKSPPELRLANGKIHIPSILRDDNWAFGIGTLQRAIDELSLSTNRSLHFDFSRCLWIDPLPALSLLIEMARAKHMGVEVSAVFPTASNLKEKDQSDDGKRINIYPSTPNKFLRFLASEGYFSTLVAQGIHATAGKELLDSSAIEKYSSLDVVPAYADASFIPFYFFDVPKLPSKTGNHDEPRGFAAETLAMLLNNVDRLLHTRCSPSERHSLLYTLRAVLQEFLHNVQEHAYPAAEFRPVALYVRYRKGGVGLASSKEGGFYAECVSQERTHGQRNQPDWLNARKGCLEVFFIDRGVGMTRTLERTGFDKHHFDKSMRSTFVDGCSRKKSTERTTEHGGLHLLHILLNRRHDYIRALEDNTWFGSLVPFPRENEQVTEFAKDVELNDGLVGLAYHVRLSWKASTDESEKWLRFGENEARETMNALTHSFSAMENLLAKNGLVIDERFGSCLVEFGQTDNFRYVLWLPKRNLMKWDVLVFLSRIAENISTPCRLIIADIPSIEAAVYEAAISRANFGRREEWPAKFERILLATNRWSFAYATYVKNERTGFHGFSPLSATEIPEQFAPQDSKDGQGISFRKLVVGWLKLHDSKCFWKQAEKVGRLYLSESVVWEEKYEPKLSIDGYLDFPAATHDRYCAQLLSNALARVFGFFPTSPIELLPVDSLAAPIIHDVYAHEAFDPPIQNSDEGIRLAVGSVLVSGSTLGATGPQDNSIHFFVHPMSPVAKEHASLFHWIPAVHINAQDVPQKRIGKTSAIAPEGWLSIEVPRYTKDGRLVGGRSPEDTYKDWQNPGPVIVKAGHWCYEGHHDFLTINIPDAVDDAFARNGPLAQFLVHKVLQHLGIKQHQIPENRYKFPSGESPEPGILIYRSHPSVERIMEKILGTILEENARQEVTRWIFPVLPLRMRWGGSTLLIPPRTRQAIKDAIATRKRVLIFDDAAISGRTIQDLLTSLRDFGAEPPRMLTIANRLRLPAETGAIDYFWRLDVPTMGREGSCPLCQALNVGRSFATSMVKPSEAFNTFTRWLKDWEAVSPLNKWHAGLDPLPLGSRETKKYCYRPMEKQYKAKIDIYRSTGLMVHAAELHAMTAADDYGLQKIRTHMDQCMKTDPAIKIGMAASQLLLFGDEFDHDLVRDLLIEGLLYPLSELPSESPYGPLALLTIMKTLAGVSQKVKEAVAKQTKRKIDALSESQHGQLLIAFLVSQDVIPWSDNSCYAGIRLLSTRHRHIADKLRSLFRETLTSTGSHHSEPIPRLADILKQGQRPSQDQVWAALNSIASLKDTLTDIGTDLVAERGEPKYEIRRQELIAALDATKTELEVLLDAFDANSPNAQKALQTVNVCLNSILDCYFYRVSATGLAEPEAFAKELVSRLGNMQGWEEFLEAKKEMVQIGKPFFQLSSDSCSKCDFAGAKTVWIVWVKPILSIIRDLSLNCAYRNIKIVDPWLPTTGNQGEKSDVWIHVAFHSNHVEISFANSCQLRKKSNEIFEEVKKNARTKTRWDIVSQLGGVVELTEKLKGRAGLYAVTVTLPYASFIAPHIDERHVK